MDEIREIALRIKELREICDYSEEDIDRIYTFKESLPENQNFIKINQKETLAQIFTDIRYKKEDNENISECLMMVLKRQGFDKKG